MAMTALSHDDREYTCDRNVGYDTAPETVFEITVRL